MENTQDAPMRRLPPLALLLALLLAAALPAADIQEALLHFNATTDKPALEYEVGEPITFTVTFGPFAPELPPGTTVHWARRGDDGLREGGSAPWTPEAPVTYTPALNTQGFVWVYFVLVDGQGNRVRQKDGRDVYANCGAAVHPEALQGVPEPADFDAYWDAQKALLKQVPLKATRTLVKRDEGRGLSIYAVSIDCAGRRPATGFLSIPDKAQKEKLPAVAYFHGYGYNASLFQQPPDFWDQARITFQVNAHGADLMQPAEYYEEFEKGIRSGNYPYAFDPQQNASPDTAYFHDMVLRVLRALEYLKSLPEWNGKDLVVEGGSQGGLQTIWAAALDHDVSLAKPSIPWNCDAAGQSTFGREFGSWRIPYAPGLEYFDCIHMAPRIQCPVEITRAGLGDYVCPPSGVAIFYNRMKCPKTIHWYQGSDHGYYPKGTEIFTLQEPQKP